MANNKDEVIDRLIGGMNSFLCTKTVVGEPITLGDTVIVPLVDVSFGMGASSGSGEKKARECGGIGGRMSPSAVLVISKGSARVVNVKNQDTMTKLLDLVPDVVNKFTQPKDIENPVSDEAAVDIAFDRSENL